MSIKCPKCNKSEDVVLNDGPEFEDDDGIIAIFDCEACDITFRAEFAIQIHDTEIIKGDYE